MKVYEVDEVCDIFSEHVYKKFKTAGMAATHYGVTDAFISNIKRKLAAPNSDMLSDIGFERKNGFIKNGRKK